MRINSLKLVNFRCFEAARFQFQAGVNLVVGPNGSGKSSLLEAIAYVSTPRSFRGALDKQVIRKGTPGFFLSAEVERKGASSDITVEVRPGSKKIRINGKRISSFADLFSTLVVLAVGPDSHGVASGPPEEGRKFLDWALSLMDREYYQHLLAYRKALSQKNALLKGKKPRLEPWNRQMEHHGRFLVDRRTEFVSGLNAAAPGISRKPVKLVYKPSCSMEPGSLSRFAKTEIERGYALAGPHRDRLKVLVNNEDARVFASSGERRIAQLELILAARRLFERKLGEPPVLVMDEPAGVLDDQHLEALLRALEGQVIYTDVLSRIVREGVIKLG